MLEIYAPTTLADIQEFVQTRDRVSIVGNGTKRTPIDTAGTFANSQDTSRKPAHAISLREWSGVIEYDPSEFTLTAKSGTTLKELNTLLSSHGQYMPFDPPLIEQGATLGGAVASGISGPCRLRYGGMRDFVLGVRLVDGLGKLITAGGKVVKNAAGFDIPKWLVGSWGQLGVITEVTLKVLPRPEEHHSVKLQCSGLKEALAWVQQLSRSSIEIDGLDIDELHSVLVRVGGSPQAATAAANRVQFIAKQVDQTRMVGDEEAKLWNPLLAWSWHRTENSFLRIPVSHRMILESEESLKSLGARIRYSVAGNLAWLDVRPSINWEQLNQLLMHYALSGRTLRASTACPALLGKHLENPFTQRIREAMDAQQKFT